MWGTTKRPKPRFSSSIPRRTLPAQAEIVQIMTCAMIFSEIDRFSSSRAEGLREMSSLFAAAQNKIAYEQGERWRQTLLQCKDSEIDLAKLSETVPAMADYVTRNTDATPRGSMAGGVNSSSGDDGSGSGGGTLIFPGQAVGKAAALEAAAELDGTVRGNGDRSGTWEVHGEGGGGSGGGVGGGSGYMEGWDGSSSYSRVENV